MRNRSGSVCKHRWPKNPSGHLGRRRGEQHDMKNAVVKSVHVTGEGLKERLHYNMQVGGPETLH